MRMPHTPYHWIMVALIAAALLLALSEARGQSTGATAFGSATHGEPVKP